MFASKATAYLSGGIFRCFPSVVSSLPYPKILDFAGKTCQGQTL
jgi:hypothetical protein